LVYPASCYCSGFNWGNSITSLIDCEFVSSITSLSIPMPSPAAGGIPYSSALTKSSSIQCASSSPCAFASTCVRNLCLCSIGSLSSENAFAISLDVINSSNLSASAWLPGFLLARGESSTGWSIINTGWINSGSTFSLNISSSIFPGDSPSVISILLAFAHSLALSLLYLRMVYLMFPGPSGKHARLVPR
jgi:hypothetical protein